MAKLNQWEEEDTLDDQKAGVGAVALRALSDCADKDVRAPSCETLSCRWEQIMDSTNHDDNTWSIAVDCPKYQSDQEDEMPRELLCVLSRIMIQSAATLISRENEKIKDDSAKSVLLITLPLLEGEGCQKVPLSEIIDSDNHEGIRNLFHPLNPEYSSMEIVDMVNQEGDVLGSLPRPFVHTWNILHRGVGLIVTKDQSILDADSANLPEVYVHQRTSTKRIFPSLYDMFVGGVSSTGEKPEWTAAREVAEELGLKGALEYLELESKIHADSNGDLISLKTNPLSEKLFQCTVCTSYNRCVVSMFAYKCNTESEEISWQEEEVAWGDFVPYEIVECAGGMSIERLVQNGDWLGSIFSGVGETLAMASCEKIEQVKSKYNNIQSWEKWDFVPDGLLVWEAWLNWWKRNNER